MTRVMSAFRKPVSWAVMVAVAVATLWLAASASFAATKRISGAGTEWVPRKRTIDVGDRIVWKAVSNPHTVTAYRKKSGRRGRRWSKNTVLDEGERTRKRFKKPGLYRFKCTFHEGMKGRIRVVR